MWRGRTGRRPGLAVAAAGLALAVATAATPADAAAAAAGYSSIIQSEAAYVASAQFTSAECPGAAVVGAIASEPWPAGSQDDVFVDPYEDNYGALALVLAGGDSYLNDAFAYIKWYLNSFNSYARADTFQGVAGSISDFSAHPSTCTQTAQDRYDSSDAYAGTFLSLVWAFVRADPAQVSYFAQPGPRWKLGVIAHAILGTQNLDGLTFNLRNPSSTRAYDQGEYTMDNVQAYQGLADYATLLGVEGNPYGETWWNGYASLVYTGIADYEWLPSANAYRDASDQATAGFTPCGAGQVNMFPAAYLLNTASWRAQVIKDYASANPGWSDTHDDSWCNFCNAGTVLYYGLIVRCPANTDTETFTGYAAAQTGETAAADTWLGNSQANWVDVGRPYPWTVIDSGFRAMTAYVLMTGQTWIP